MSINETRDNELGALLDSIPTPSHDDTFFASLESQMQEVDAKPSNIRRITFRAVSVALPVAIAASAAAFVLLQHDTSANKNTNVAIPTTTVPTSQPVTPTDPPVSGPQTLLASQIIEKAQSRLATTKTLKAVVDYTYVDSDGTKNDNHNVIAVDSDGNYKRSISGSAGDPATETYNAATGVYAMQVENAYSDTHVAPLYDPLWNFTAIASSMDTLAKVDGLRAEDTSVDGRDVWKISYSPDPKNVAIYEPTHYEFVVDKSTFMVTSEVLTYRNSSTTMKLSDVVLDAPLTKSDLTMKITAPDSGAGSESWQRTTLQDVKRLAGYTPIVPSALPDGFKPIAVWYLDNPQSYEQEPKAIVVTYRRGLQTIEVGTARPSSPKLANDPLAGDIGGFTTETKLVTGAFANQSASINSNANFPPHIFVAGKFTTAHIQGPLTRDELIVAMNSMAEYHP